MTSARSEIRIGDDNYVSFCFYSRTARFGAGRRRGFRRHGEGFESEPKKGTQRGIPMPPFFPAPFHIISSTETKRHTYRPSKRSSKDINRTRVYSVAYGNSPINLILSPASMQAEKY